MCKLCETITNPNKLENDKSIIKTSENTYELVSWQPKNDDIIDSEYEIFATIEITECPECNRKLGD